MNHKNIQLRPARKNDCHILFEWVNNPHVRAMSLNSAPIGWEEHCTWFNRKLNDALCQIYIGFYENQPVGHVRFDIENDTAYTGISVAQAHRSAGLGGLLLQLGVNKIFNETSIKRICATVKVDNIPSQRIFEKCGFLLQTPTLEGVCTFFLENSIENRK